MTLSKSAILSSITNGEINVKPFYPKFVGPNSIDVHLAKTLYLIKSHTLNIDNEYDYRKIDLDDPAQRTLLPGFLYLGCTQEWFYTPEHVPILHGRSSAARYGINVHQTAGFGDVGFSGHWTFEITVVNPIVIRPYIRIAQVQFETLQTADDNAITEDSQYAGRYNNEYSSDPEPRLPVPGNF